MHQPGEAIDEQNVGFVREPRQHARLALARGVHERETDLFACVQAPLAPRVLHGDGAWLRGHAEESAQVHLARRDKGGGSAASLNAVAEAQLRGRGTRHRAVFCVVSEVLARDVLAKEEGGYPVNVDGALPVNLDHVSRARFLIVCFLHATEQFLHKCIELKLELNPVLPPFFGKFRKLS